MMCEAIHVGTSSKNFRKVSQIEDFSAVAIKTAIKPAIRLSSSIQPNSQKR